MNANQPLERSGFAGAAQRLYVSPQALQVGL